MTDLPPFRLKLLRAAYLLLIVGLGTTVWPAVIDPASRWAPDRGVVVAMLSALSLLALVGLRHPVNMLPILFWELTWKSIWLLRVALPLWRDGPLDAATSETSMECLMGVLIAIVVPWDHVWRTYVRGVGEAWRSGFARRIAMPDQRSDPPE